MFVVCEQNCYGTILSEELDRDRPAWEANERAWLSQGQARRLEKTVFSPFWHCHEFFREKCSLLGIAHVLLITKATIL